MSGSVAVIETQQKSAHNILKSLMIRPGVGCDRTAAFGNFKSHNTKEVSMKNFNWRVRPFAFAVVVSGVLIVFGGNVFGQETAGAVKPEVKPSPEGVSTAAIKATPAVMTPAVTELRGISLGMTADEVKIKLGKPMSQDDSGMFFTFSDTESAQIRFDPDGKVRTIAMMYSKGDSDAPKFEDIFGPNVQMAANDDGHLYKMVRYPAAGIWIAYSKIGSDKDALTTVTMKRIGAN